MRDHTALIERTRHTRITADNAPAIRAKARQCQWCARNALRLQPWCARHGPGTSKERQQVKQRRAGAGAMGRAILNECAAERMLPNELEAWAPIARIIAHRPRHTRPVLLADVMQALAALAMDNPDLWVAVVRRMRDTGMMRDSDKGFIGWHARHGKRPQRTMMSGWLCERCAA